MTLTVKEVIKILESFDGNLIVGYVDPYSKFHPLKEEDVYKATGHFDPSQPDRSWQSLLTETKPKRVVQFNVPQVGIPQRRHLEKNEEDEWRDYGYRECLSELKKKLEVAPPNKKLAEVERFISEHQSS